MVVIRKFSQILVPESKERVVRNDAIPKTGSVIILKSIFQ